MYAGTGLRGYGKLVIVKHDNTSSAPMPTTRTLLVKEGQAVTKGQKIAGFGDTVLEIRRAVQICRQGKPVDQANISLPADSGESRGKQNRVGLVRL